MRAGTSARTGAATTGVARLIRSGLGTGADAVGRAGRRGRAAPRVLLTLGRSVPGTVVRLTPVVLVAVVGALVQAAPATWAVLGVLTATLVVRPALPAVAGVVLVAGLVSLVGPDLLAPVADPGNRAGPVAGAVGPLTLALLALCLDALLRVAALTPHVAWTARVEVSVVARLGRSLARTQVLGQGLLWLAFGLRAADVGLGGGALPRIAALVAAGVLLAVLVPRRGRTDAGGWGPP